MFCPSFDLLNYSTHDSALHKKHYRGERMVSAYEFELYTEDCEGGVAINGVRYNAKKSCFSLTKPGQRVKMISPYKCCFFNIYTQDESLAEVLDGLPEFGVLWNMDEAVKIFYEMLAIEPTAMPENRMQLQGCVCRLLSLIIKARPLVLENGVENALTHRRVLQQVDRYIREHYMEDLSLTSLAALCSLHPNYFHRLYTEAFGKTPSQRILGCRIGAAKMLLLTQNLTMSEIATQCGFSSQTYFGFKFKEVMGMTPLQYRRKRLNSRKADVSAADLQNQL